MVCRRRPLDSGSYGHMADSVRVGAAVRGTACSTICGGLEPGEGVCELGYESRPVDIGPKTGRRNVERPLRPPGLDSAMSLLLDAAGRGELAYEDVARVYSENPARTYGLWPRKGHISPGADADLALADPAARRIVHNEDVLSEAGWTSFHGREVRGRAVRTYLRVRSSPRKVSPPASAAVRSFPGAGRATRDTAAALGVPGGVKP
jgi:hypothetical protein